nr:MAG TPA: hypothetical protein [Caudoviricetes sp.]
MPLRGLIPIFLNFLLSVLSGSFKPWKDFPRYCRASLIVKISTIVTFSSCLIICHFSFPQKSVL